MKSLKRLAAINPDTRFLGDARARLAAYLLANPAPPPRRTAGWVPLARPIAALALIGAVLFFGSGMVYAAEAALPGQALYPVKRASERLRLTITRNPKRRALLLRQFGERRAAEAQVVRPAEAARELRELRKRLRVEKQKKAAQKRLERENDKEKVKQQ